MAEHKYTSLKDLLKGQKPPKLGRNNKSEEIPLVTDLFGELYFRESSSSSSSSIGDLKFSPPLPLPKVSSEKHAKINQELHDGPKGDVTKKDLNKKDCCMYNNSTKLFPPPISTLRTVETGESFEYQRFDDNANAFVREEMAASRENGRLRVEFAHDHGQEEDEMKEDQEAMEAVSDGDGEELI